MWISYGMKVAQSSPTLCNLRDYTSPRNSPGQNTEVGSLSFLQGFFPTQGLNSGLLRCRWIRYQQSHKGSSYMYMCIFSLLSLPPTPQPHTNLTPLSHPRAPSWASCAIQQLPTYGSVYTSVLLSQFVPPAPSRLVSISLSHHLCLYSCLTNRFTNTIFLDSIYMRNYMIFVFLFLTDFTLYDRL